MVALRAEINDLKTKSSTKSAKCEPEKGKQPSAGNSKRKSPATRDNCQDLLAVPPPKGKLNTEEMGNKTYN